MGKLGEADTPLRRQSHASGPWGSGAGGGNAPTRSSGKATVVGCRWTGWANQKLRQRAGILLVMSLVTRGPRCGQPGCLASGAGDQGADRYQWAAWQARQWPQQRQRRLALWTECLAGTEEGQHSGRRGWKRRPRRAAAQSSIYSASGQKAWPRPWKGANDQGHSSGEQGPSRLGKHHLLSACSSRGTGTPSEIGARAQNSEPPSTEQAGAPRAQRRQVRAWAPEPASWRLIHGVPRAGSHARCQVSGDLL